MHVYVDRISTHDRAILVLQETPGCRDQQVLEALAMLVALRVWAPRWTSSRVLLTVRSDNMSTLALVAKMQPHSPQLGVVAREMALDIAGAAYAPDVTEHLPGAVFSCKMFSDSFCQLLIEDVDHTAKCSQHVAENCSKID